MKSLFLSGCVSVLSLASISSSASPRDRDRDHDRRPGAPGNYGCYVPNQASIAVRRWVQNETLPLRQLFNLGPECDGKRIQSVTLVAATDRRSRAAATLLVNQYPASYQQALTGYTRPYDFYMNPGYDILGRDIQTLQLAIQGMAWVEGISITMEDSWGQPYPGPQPGPRPGPGPQPGPGPRPGPGPQPGPGPRPGPYPGPGPQPGPGPRPGPQPQPAPVYYPVWSISAQGGYYDTTGRIQGAHRLPAMRQFGGTLVSGEPVPQVPVVVNSMGHICNIPATAPGLGVCTQVPTHYE